MASNLTAARLALVHFQQLYALEKDQNGVIPPLPEKWKALAGTQGDAARNTLGTV